MERRAPDASVTPQRARPSAAPRTAAPATRSWLSPPRSAASRLLTFGALLTAATMCSALWLNQLGRDVATAAVRGMGSEAAGQRPQKGQAGAGPEGTGVRKGPDPARHETSTEAAAGAATRPEWSSQPAAPLTGSAILQPEPQLWVDSEADILQRLASEPLVDARKGSGGRTLAFKLTLSSGIRAYFKPEQEVSSAHWYSEVAAYHLDRALGLHRVPPLVGRVFPWSKLEAAAGSDGRVAELAIGRGGQLRGALIFWLEARLVRAVTPPGWENWIRAEPFPRNAVTPYQRASAYGAALRRRREQGPRVYYEHTPVPDRPQLPAELSDMIVFDFLTINYDRFGGENANILTLGPRGPLIFLDNGDGFSAGPPRRSVLDARLAPLSRFRRRTVEALRAFDLGAFAARLAREPLAPILDAAALDGLATRREIVLEHVAAQRKRYGDAIFAW